MARIIKPSVQVVRGRGRPRQDTVRVECMVPREVMRLLIQREREGQGYRTRVASRVLCEWYSRSTGGKSPFGAVR
jgi:hypothetical protein